MTAHNAFMFFKLDRNGVLEMSLSDFQYLMGETSGVLVIDFEIFVLTADVIFYDNKLKIQLRACGTGEKL